jgi:hypothetical protein
VLIEAAVSAKKSLRRGDQAVSRRLTQRGSFTWTNGQYDADVDFAGPRAITRSRCSQMNPKLSLVNGDTITVDGVEGDIETSNVNGPASR